MKLIIAGSRSLVLEVDYLRELYLTDWPKEFPSELATEIVSGGAIGIDKCGEELAARMGLPVVRFLPEYSKYNPKIAPIMRNKEMAKYADCLWVFMKEGQASNGSMNMISEMRKLNKPVSVEWV